MTAGSASWAGVRGELRSMPAPVAAAFVLLTVASMVVMLLALLSGLLAEFAERLAGAGWAGASTLRTGHRVDPVVADRDEAGWRGYR